MEQVTGLIMATVFLFSQPPDHSRLHPGEIIQLVGDGVTILRNLPPYEGNQWTWGAPTSHRTGGPLIADQERVFELSWRGNAPRFYLEQQAPDLYRRVELADRDGYTVSLLVTDDGPELTVQVEATRKALTATTYDEALDAFVGKPTLLKTVCTTSATVKPGRNTVVLWQPPGRTPKPPLALAPDTAATGVPPWAQGRWRLVAGGDATEMEVLANGTVVFRDWPDMPIPVEIGADGAVRLEFAPEGEDDRVLVVGRLTPDGTGRGSISEVAQQDDSTWTAIRLGPNVGVEPVGLGAAAVPPWVIGKWRIELQGGDSTEMEMRPDGTVVAQEWPNTPITAQISADGQIQLSFVPEGEAFEVLAKGRLSPDGAGSGVFTTGDGDEAEQGGWTATRLVRPPKAAPILPVTGVPAGVPPPTPAAPKAAPAALPPVAIPGAKTAPALRPAARAADLPGIGILLQTQAPPAGGAGPAAASGLEDVKIEISTVWVEVPVDSPEWDELQAAGDRAQLLGQLIAEERVQVVAEPRVRLSNNQRAQMVDRGARPYDAKASPANALSVIPSILGDGSISMALESQFHELGARVTGPDGETTPIITSQTAKTRVAAADGQPVLMSVFTSRRSPADEPGRQPTETMIMVTARVADPGAVAATIQQAKRDEHLATCRNNVKQLCLAANLYANDPDHDMALPAGDWWEELTPYHVGPETYVCPARPDVEIGYAFNALLAGAKLGEIKRPDSTVLFYEADLAERQATGGGEVALTAPRHGDQVVVGFMDCRTRTVSVEELKELLDRDPFK